MEMAGNSGVWTPTNNMENYTNCPKEMEKNKFVFVNRNREHTLFKPSRVLINPHFKENKKVFLNPNFQGMHSESSVRPKVHVNPNILKSLSSTPSYNDYNLVDAAQAISSHQVSTTNTYNYSNPSVANFSAWNYRGSTPDDGKSVAVVQSNINNSRSLQQPPVVKAETYRPNLFRKINSSVNTVKADLTKTKHSDSIPNTHSQEQSIMESFVHQRAVESLKNQQKTHLKLNPQVGPRNTLQNQRMLHTRLKIVNTSKNIPNDVLSNTRKPKSNSQMIGKSICTRFKYIRKVEASTPVKINTSESSKPIIGNTRKKDNFGSGPIRRNSIITRFKYVRNGAKLMKINKTPMKSKYKIVNNTPGTPMSTRKTVTNTSPYRKKYVYLNKFNSSSFLANNVIFKNSKQRNLININGILYRNSPCLLKRASIPSKSSHLHSGLKGNNTVKQLVKCQGKYKIVRSQLASGAKLRKSNMACAIYKKTGKCNGQTNGTCIKVHNPDQIILCKRFLQGVCVNNKCLLSHKVSSEKMPTCKYFLEGKCNKNECQYLHVKISPNADICKDFLEGFCKEGIKCDKRHQYLCPEFEKFQKCSKPKCEYPHGTAEIKRKPEKKKFKKVTTKKPVKNTPPKEAIQEVAESCQIRYYKENSDEAAETTTIDEELIPKRQKLGSLPSFIPIV